MFDKLEPEPHTGTHKIDRLRNTDFLHLYSICLIFSGCFLLHCVSSFNQAKSSAYQFKAEKMNG
jgi:hypothetical protein